jgi:cephalosporin hydroxylase
VDIDVSHKCNLLSLELIAKYYDVEYAEVKAYYHELEDDVVFLNALNERMDASRKLYSKGLFSHGKISSIDWFANQRIIQYVLIRLLKPDIAVETGVFYGGTTAFILNALRKNKSGRLISIDLSSNELADNSFERHDNVGDSEIVPEGLKTGFIIPQYLKERWEFIEGNSLDVLKRIKGPFTFFSHDSEHSYRFVLSELELVKSIMPISSTIMADDIDWSNGFIEFCVNNKLYPLFLTDNGKDGLNVRLGLVRLDHPNIGKQGVTD